MYGRDLDPSFVSDETGLVANVVRQAGDRLGSKTFNEGMWSFNGREAGDEQWNSLQEGLVFVLDAISHVDHLFKKYRERWMVIWWCGHFQSAFDGGPRLSADVLRKLGDFGAELYIDTYFHRDDC